MAKTRRNTYFNTGGNTDCLGPEEIYSINIVFSSRKRGYWCIRTFAKVQGESTALLVGGPHEILRVHQASPVGLLLQSFRKSVAAAIVSGGLVDTRIN